MVYPPLLRPVTEHHAGMRFNREPPVGCRAHITSPDPRVLRHELSLVRFVAHMLKDSVGNDEIEAARAEWQRSAVAEHTRRPGKVQFRPQARNHYPGTG